MNYYEALGYALKYKEKLSPLCKRIEIAGSIRRKKPDDIKDIEFVLIPDTKKLYDYKTLIESWTKSKGETLGRYTQRFSPEGIKMDIFRATEKNWGMIFAIRTGSADYSHNVLAVGWKKKGYESEGGILHKVDKIDGPDFINFTEEEELFKFIGIPFAKPEDREWPPIKIANSINFN